MIRALRSAPSRPLRRAARRVRAAMSRRVTASLGRVDQGRADRGSVTAELALALPALLLVLGALLAVVAAGSGQLQVADAARTGARVAALGEDDAAVVAAAQRVGGPGVDVAVTRDPPWVVVTARRSVAQGWASALPLTLTSSATARTEP